MMPTSMHLCLLQSVPLTAWRLPHPSTSLQPPRRDRGAGSGRRRVCQGKQGGTALRSRQGVLREGNRGTAAAAPTAPRYCAPRRRAAVACLPACLPRPAAAHCLSAPLQAYIPKKLEDVMNYERDHARLTSGTDTGALLCCAVLCRVAARRAAKGASRREPAPPWFAPWSPRALRAPDLLPVSPRLPLFLFPAEGIYYQALAGMKADMSGARVQQEVSSGKKKGGNAGSKAAVQQQQAQQQAAEQQQAAAPLAPLTPADPSQQGTAPAAAAAATAEQSSAVQQGAAPPPAGEQQQQEASAPGSPVDAERAAEPAAAAAAAAAAAEAGSSTKKKKSVRFADEASGSDSDGSGSGSEGEWEDRPKMTREEVKEMRKAHKKEVRAARFAAAAGCRRCRRRREWRAHRALHPPNHIPEAEHESPPLTASLTRTLSFCLSTLR